jgi:D-beta-D-heptose 7-phosphate kinase/D-beta-D-heptose 1-phosphate adenosyltransferase
MTITDVFRLTDARVMVVGDVILDEYLEGRVRRISPEAPVPVLVQDTRRVVLGGAANVAANVTALGGRAWLVGRVGTDRAGAEVRELLARAEIAHHLVLSAAVPTTRKTRVVDHFQQIARVDCEDDGPITAEEEDRAFDAVADFVAAGGRCSVILSDYGKGMLTTKLVRRILALCVDERVPVVADPKTRDVGRFAGATVLKPNVGEALHAVRDTPYDREDLGGDHGELARAVRSLAQVANVVMSRSEAGVVAVGEHIEGELEVPSVYRDVSDVSGAGDTMVAVIGAGLAVGVALSESVRLANVGAGVACSRKGTTPVRLHELADAHEELAARRPGDKILTDPDMVRRIARALHRQGRRIVFTNGCFDILHAGHVQLLHAARRFGDLLVVGVNDDDSVRRLKGPERPINPLADRATVLAALACVDFVAPFTADTPIDLVDAVRPDVLVKGGDYDAASIVGAPEVASWGGRVEIVPLLEGRSTTEIVERSAERGRRDG